MKNSYIQNFKFVFKTLKHTKLSTIIFASLVKMIAPILPIAISSYIIYSLTENVMLEKILFNITILVSLLGLCNFLDTAFKLQLEGNSSISRFKLIEQVSIRAFLADYQTFETEEYQTIMNKIINDIGSGDSILNNLYITIAQVTSTIFSLIFYGYLLIKLNPIIIVVITISALTHYLLMKKENTTQKERRKAMEKPNLNLRYLANYSFDYSIGKDVRIYGLATIFAKKFTQNADEFAVITKLYENKSFVINIFVGLITFFRDLICYGLLVKSLINNSLSAGDFVFNFGIIGMFAVTVYSVSTIIKTFDDSNAQLTECRDFMDIPDRLNRGVGVPLPTDDFSIEIKNISFRFPNKETNTLSNINLSIKNGEKIAIVGLNGAGKTTLVKLICGLYEITEGEILVGGNNINAYNIFEYYSLLSAVFQETLVLPSSIKNNITNDKKSTQNLEDIINKSGLNIDKFPKGLDTICSKALHDDGIEVSGGELQKLALAKALYKDGKILILDEPTAELDPIAEQEMYLNYSDMSQGKTSIFISHRLSSARFCDRIILLDEGKIIEIGSHDELMNKSGKYKELFDLQSHYYKEELDKNFDENLDKEEN